MSEELKPFQFCGKTARVIRTIDRYFVGGKNCDHALCPLEEYDTPEKAVADWIFVPRGLRSRPNYNSCAIFCRPAPPEQEA